MISRIKQWFKEFFTLTERFGRIQISPDVVEDICALAKGAHPKEMIAFLTGEVKDQTLVITGLYVKSYHANERQTSFTTHDLPLTGVYGTVHSHPGPSNRPSSADKQLFNKQGYFHLIINRPYRAEHIAAYNKYGERIEL